tara:strand:+ start:808 stop:1041 length:234 start_codon:yes stop_codon:yes gene_type:complete
MILEYLNMGGYGLFVWSSFGIVIIACYLVFYKTRKTLLKYEKDFLKELTNLSEKNRQDVLKKSKVAKQFLATETKLN